MSNTTGGSVEIYALVDPRTNVVRYIGKANDSSRRFRRHLKDARDGKTDHKSRWIASLLRDGLRPIITSIERCTAENWKERECYWIAEYRRRGCDLTNSTNGGDGGEPTEETRLKMSVAKRGKPAHNKGIPASLEARQKQRDAAQARFAAMTDGERKQYMQPANSRPHVTASGWHHTEDARAKISASLHGNKRMLGHKASDATKAKMSRARIGRLVSAETRSKISISNKNRAVERREGKTNG